MIKEIAITPDIFDVARYTDDQVPRLIECLRKLGRMFIRESHGRDNALCIGNLADGAWLAEIRRNVDKCSNPSVKHLLRDLLKQFDTHQVRREYESNLPQDAEEWLQEAIRSHEQNRSFDRIASSSADALPVGKVKGLVGDVTHVVDETFADSIRGSVDVEDNIERQVEALQPLFTRADWLTFVLPDLRENHQPASEGPFLRSCLRSCVKRRDRARGLRVRVVTLAARKSRPETDSKFQKNASDTREHVSDLIRQEAGSHILEPEVIIDPNVLDRYLIAGTGEVDSQRARWAVSLAHPSRNSRASRLSRHATFQLLSAMRLGQLYNEYCQ